MKAAIIIVTVLALWAVAMNADFWLNSPTPQQEAEDVASDLAAARKQARKERREQWLEAEMKRRGCQR